MRDFGANHCGILDESLLKAETNSFTHHKMGTYDPDGHEMA